MAILAQLQRLFAPNANKMKAQELYLAIVNAARNPVFYEQWGVPDTLDGRFDMVALHISLVQERLKESFANQPETQDLTRLLTEIFFADMDRSLREMGVGDTGVGKRIKVMASAFNGRREAYGNAQNSSDMWRTALSRNIYGTTSIVPEFGLAELVNYAINSRQHLADQSLESLLNGAPDFPCAIS